jgi:hypothetical protein
MQRVKLKNPNTSKNRNSLFTKWIRIFIFFVLQDKTKSWALTKIMWPTSNSDESNNSVNNEVKVL